jgi:starch phosphorylase
LTLHKERFDALLKNTKYPIQIIWAGKPYPEDYGAIEIFNELFWLTLPYPNATVLTGYELNLSAKLKRGSDVWLNNPKITREASGTSGMTAAMNGSVNFSIPDGWIPEFAKHGKNCFLIDPADASWSPDRQNEDEATRMLDMLENEILPTYYDNKKKWAAIVREGIKTVAPAFDSDRMADEYYRKLFA